MLKIVKVIKSLIVKTNQMFDDGNVIRKLHENDFFGLISLFTNSTKNYDLVSISDIEILELHTKNLIELTSRKSDSITLAKPRLRA